MAWVSYPQIVHCIGVAAREWKRDARDYLLQRTTTRARRRGMPLRNSAIEGGHATCSRFLCGGYARNALQVIGDLNLLPLAKQMLDPVYDASADLDDQPAAGPQSGARLRNQAFDHFQTGWPGENCIARFEFADLELHFVCLRFANVGRVGYHKIETAGIESVQQIGLVKMNPALELVACGVGMGHFECA